MKAVGHSIDNCFGLRMKIKVTCPPDEFIKAIQDSEIYKNELRNMKESNIEPSFIADGDSVSYCFPIPYN